MKIVILGLGETGFYLAQFLLKQGHDLILIEKDEDQVRYANERLDAQIVEGNGANPLVLEPLIDETTDIFIAVTGNDETNIIATMIARRFGAHRAIARVSDTANLIHPLLTDDAKVSLVNAEITVARDLTRLVGNPFADEIEFFAHGRAEMLKLDVSPDSEIAYKKLKEMRVPRSWLFVAVIRKGDFSIVSGDTILEPGDHVLVMGDPQKSKEIEKLMGLKPVKIRRVILVGFNNISLKLAQSLQKRNIDVRLIEEKEDVAEEAAGALDGVLVIQGDGTNEEILDQAGIDQTDYLLALTPDDENNILISLLAKEKNVKRVIALAQKRQYKPIIEKIGIDSVVNPRSAMVDEILHCIHQEDFSDINILEGGKGQMIEFVLDKKTKVVDVPLSKIKLPKQTLIGAIVRGNDLVIPRGQDKLKIGDHVVVFTTQAVLSEVKKLFSN